MVEVPAVAIVPELFAEAAFFSIGSNDLTQYVTAAARDSPDRVADLQRRAAHPPSMRLIARVAAYGRDTGIDVSLCGDAAAVPALIPCLLKAGFAVCPSHRPCSGAAKAAIAEVTIGRSDG